MFYLLSHNRPMSELLKPNLLDMRRVFASEFEDITTIAFSYDDFEATRDMLVQLMKTMLTEDETRFLMSFKKGGPTWGLSGIPRIEHYPAIQWKLHNIQKMNAQKRAEAENKLAVILGY